MSHRAVRARALKCAGVGRSPTRSVPPALLLVPRGRTRSHRMVDLGRYDTRSRLGTKEGCSHHGNRLSFVSQRGNALRVIARSTLSAFWKGHADAEQQLRAWYQEAEEADWRTAVDVQRSYPKASILKDGRFVFNICGNRYRLVVHCRHPYAFVRFIGTHAEYDRIDAQTC